MLQAPEILTTERLVLRCLMLSDADVIFSGYAQDPEVARYMTWRSHKDIEETISFLEEYLARWQSGEEFTWAITQRGGDRVIGVIGCRIKGHAADIGYALVRQYWNQGYMTEAAQAVTEWLASLPAVFRIWATCDTENPASARVMEKTGMTCEGVLRRWIMHPNISSEPRDCFVYSKVRGEF